MSRETDLKRALAFAGPTATTEDNARKEALLATAKDAVWAAREEITYNVSLIKALLSGDLRDVDPDVIEKHFERFKRDLEDTATAPGPRWSLHVAALDDRKRVLDVRDRLLDGSQTSYEAAKALGLRRWTILLGTLDDAQIAGLFGHGA